MSVFSLRSFLAVSFVLCLFAVVYFTAKPRSVECVSVPNPSPCPLCPDPVLPSCSVCPVCNTTTVNNTTAVRRRDKIYSVVTFMNEFATLQLRLKIMESAVDYFVIIEADRMFSGGPKPCYLTDEMKKTRNESAYPYLFDFGSRLRVRCLTSQHYKPHWKFFEMERNTRDLSLYIPETLDALDSDWMLLSDLDEYVNPVSLSSALDNPSLESAVFQCKFFYYSYSWFFVSEPLFGAPSLTRFGALRTTKAVMPFWRQGKSVFPYTCWHCSYCFGPTIEKAVSMIIDKITSFSHGEYNKLPYIDPKYLRCAVLRGLSPFWYQPPAGQPFSNINPHFVLQSVNPLLEAPPAVIQDPELHYLLGIYADRDRFTPMACDNTMWI